VFVDLIAMARESRNPPFIQANPTTAYPHSWLASKLNIALDLLEEALEVCKAQGRISENSTGIKILNFDFYQEGIGEAKESKGIKEKYEKP
jgi:hypothetical protein